MELASCETCVTVYLPEDAQGAETLAALRAMLAQMKSEDTEGQYGRLEAVCSRHPGRGLGEQLETVLQAFPGGEKAVHQAQLGRTHRCGRGQNDPGDRPGEQLRHRTAPHHPAVPGADGKRDRSRFHPPAGSGCGQRHPVHRGMLLGAKEAYAVDIEENATRIARENAAENHLDPERYTISCGNIISDETLRQEIGSGYDVITANIVADVIKGMAPLFPGFLKDNGILILSGIITERADEVLDTVTAYDFAVLERREASGWCAVKLQKLAGAGTSCDTVRK